jgi:hypothetical protein
MDAYAVPQQEPTGHSSQPAYAPLPPPFEPPRRLRGLATALTLLFACIIVVLAINAFALMGRASLLDDMLNGPMPSDAEIDAADTFVNTTGIAFRVLLIAVAVVFIVWQFKHAKNAKLLGSTSELGPGWAIGGWFIPIANLYLPAKQLFGASRFSAEGRREWYVGGRGAPIVVWWAIALGLGLALYRFAITRAPGDDDFGSQAVADFAVSDRLEAAADAVLIITAVLAIVMVRTLTSRQVDALAKAGGGSATPPPYSLDFDSAGLAAVPEYRRRIASQGEPQSPADQGPSDQQEDPPAPR